MADAAVDDVLSFLDQTKALDIRLGTTFRILSTSRRLANHGNMSNSCRCPALALSTPLASALETGALASSACLDQPIGGLAPAQIPI